MPTKKKKKKKNLTGLGTRKVEINSRFHHISPEKNLFEHFFLENFCHRFKASSKYEKAKKKKIPNETCFISEYIHPILATDAESNAIRITTRKSERTCCGVTARGERHLSWHESRSRRLRAITYFAPSLGIHKYVAKPGRIRLHVQDRQSIPTARQRYIREARGGITYPATAYSIYHCQGGSGKPARLMDRR